jgi:putative flippase GtrA
MQVTERLLRHREVLKFLLVGGTCFAITVGINYALNLTVLANKPVTALTVATITATVVSYVLNRESSFRTRGGRERRHEPALFFVISGIAVVITDVPLWLSRYLFDLKVPHVSRSAQEVSDFASGVVLSHAGHRAFICSGRHRRPCSRPGSGPRRRPPQRRGVPLPGRHADPY